MNFKMHLVNLTTICFFFIILGPASITTIDDGKRQHQINTINDGSSSGIVIDEDEHSRTFPSGGKL
jgi:hypothetical protein